MLCKLTRSHNGAQVIYINFSKSVPLWSADQIPPRSWCSFLFYYLYLLYFEARRRAPSACAAIRGSYLVNFCTLMGVFLFNDVGKGWSSVYYYAFKL